MIIGKVQYSFSDWKNTATTVVVAPKRNDAPPMNIKRVVIGLPNRSFVNSLSNSLRQLVRNHRSAFRIFFPPALIVVC
ncbi:MAG: hypothetical protein A3J67_04705 [Parcubacteria group bacterium RIFCSPHIGHO2_02_FULL_48_10b]|nr:MAG: hypothetical protein A3J67_04705 [Parcubacteria group bacterium RIFCSPHIGHO2_02_FULL_48_10b]